MFPSTRASAARRPSRAWVLPNVLLLGSPLEAACTYTWTPSNLLTNSTISNPKTSPNTDTKFFVTVSKNGCSVKDSVSVFVFKNDTKISSNSNNLCLGDTFKLSANQACASYAWSTGQTTKDIFVLTPGWIYLTTTSTLGCIAKDSIRIDSLSKIPLSAKSFTVCLNESLQLLAPAGYVYDWEPNYQINNLQIYNPLVSPKMTVTYTLTLNNGPCQSQGTYFVKVNPLAI